MKSLFRSIFKSLLLFVSIHAYANESTSPVNTSSESKKRFSIEGLILKLDGEGITINPNIAINDKISIGTELGISRFPQLGGPYTVYGAGLVDYYFSSFSTDSFFLRPHFDVYANIDYDREGSIDRTYGYGMDVGYRFIVKENISIRPMLSNFQTLNGYCPYGTAFPFIPYLTFGYTW